MKLWCETSSGHFMEEMFFTTLARLGLTGAQAQVPVGWKENMRRRGAFSLYWGSNAFTLNNFGHSGR